MPIHDWTLVDAGTYHDFHQGWTIRIRDRLNGGILPDGYFAMADRRMSGPEPDVVALRSGGGPGPSGGLGVAEIPPRIRQVARTQTEAALYARKANRIAIHQGLGRVVSMIEIASPGNKDGRHAIASFAAKAAEFLRVGIHFLVVDPFPPGPSDPDGSAQAIWDQFVGEPLPDAPLFLAPGRYVNVPLEETYQSARDVTPRPIRDLLLAPSAGH